VVACGRKIHHCSALGHIKFISILAARIAFATPTAMTSATAKIKAVLPLMFHWNVFHWCHTGMMPVSGPIHNTMTFRWI